MKTTHVVVSLTIGKFDGFPVLDLRRCPNLGQTACCCLGFVKVASNQRTFVPQGGKEKKHKNFLLRALWMYLVQGSIYWQDYNFLVSLYITKYASLYLAQSRHTLTICWLNEHLEGMLEMLTFLAYSDLANIICIAAKKVFSLCLSCHLDYSNVFCTSMVLFLLNSCTHWAVISIGFCLSFSTPIPETPHLFWQVSTAVLGLWSLLKKYWLGNAYHSYFREQK